MKIKRFQRVHCSFQIIKLLSYLKLEQGLVKSNYILQVKAIVSHDAEVVFMEELIQVWDN